MYVPAVAQLNVTDDVGRADYIALVTNGSPVSYLWCQHVSTHFSLQVYEIKSLLETAVQ